MITERVLGKSVQDIYKMQLNMWEKLRPYFPLVSAQPPPSLMIFECNDYANIILNRGKIVSTVESTPEQMSYVQIGEILMDLVAYDSWILYHTDHKIVINRALFDPAFDLALDLAEEVTHAATNPVIGRTEVVSINIDLNELKKFHAHDGLGVRAYQALKQIPQDSFRVMPCEFYPPLGQTLIFGKDFDIAFDWEEGLNSVYQNRNRHGANKRQAGAFISHLPRLAAEIMVEEYHRDIPMLLREHPRLLGFNNKLLWEEYCLPILRIGHTPTPSLDVPRPGLGGTK